MNPSFLLKQSETDLLTDNDCECSVNYPIKPEDKTTSPDNHYQKEKVVYNVDLDDSNNSDDDDDDDEDIADIYDEIDDEMDILSICQMLNQSQEDLMFAQNGYQKVSKICDTLQGELFKARNTENGSFVAVKKICKQLTKDQIAKQDGFTFSVTEDVVKEAIILKYLTRDNSMMGDYVVKYIDFFSSATHYYLVTEYCNGVRLDQFIQIAFQYIRSGKLRLKTYQKLAKFILWQLATTLRFLHDLHHCVHLDLCLENIILQNVEFIEKKDGSISIPPTMDIKLVDFGVSEIFDSSVNDDDFQCYKHNLNIDNEGYLAPKVFENEYYDARAADMWSLGMIFYQMMTGQQLYTPRDMGLTKTNGYWALYNGKLAQWLKANNLDKFFQSKYSFQLLSSLLNVNEETRITAVNCIEHDYFKSYLTMYRSRMNGKIQRDRRRLSNSDLSNFPYYQL